ncbi:uncharacterized protein LOC142848579 [Microtus pennsylvanicus]|uniref:uncharacterized protein LOC142848579 n=1 Tax=Microtus pennsylvanicus TaxID=10058 RepID=UPI003F6B27FD
MPTERYSAIRPPREWEKILTLLCKVLSLKLSYTSQLAQSTQQVYSRSGRSLPTRNSNCSHLATRAKAPDRDSLTARHQVELDSRSRCRAHQGLQSPNPTRQPCPLHILSCPALLAYSLNCPRETATRRHRRRSALRPQPGPALPGLGLRAAGCCPRAPAHWDPPGSGREAGAARRKERCGGEKGQTLKLPGCGPRARMLSVLPTSWQQQHGPGRRRRCGNGAARVAEPVRAPARPPAFRPSVRPSSGGPSRVALGSAAVPRGAGTRDGSRRPASEAPRGGAAPELQRPGPRGPRRARRGRGAAWARTPRAGPGKRRLGGAEPRSPCSPDV